MTGFLSLHTLDVVVIMMALLATFAASRTVRASAVADSIVAGRTLTLPVFVCSVIATWYGAVLGAGEFIYLNGIAFLVCFGLPYYLVATIYALWLAPRIRSATAMSIPEMMGNRFGGTARIAAACVLLIITVPVSYQAMLGRVVSSITGWPFWMSVLVGSAFGLVLILRGGLASDARANTVQTLLMYLGFGALAFFAIQHGGVEGGSVADTWRALPDFARSLPGPAGWGGIAVWWVIALQTFVDPAFHIRAAAATTSRTARNGLLLSVAGWIVFDALQLIGGLYALAWHRVEVPANTTLVIAQAVLPAVWKGLFVSGVLAAVISSFNGYALVSANNLAYDVLRKPARRRMALVASVIAGALLAIAVPTQSVVALLYYASLVAIPGLLGPTIAAYATSTPSHSTTSATDHTLHISLLVAPCLATASLLLSGTGDVYSMLAGFLVSGAVLWLIIARESR